MFDRLHVSKKHVLANACTRLSFIDSPSHVLFDKFLSSHLGYTLSVYSTTFEIGLFCPSLYVAIFNEDGYV